MPIDCHCTIDMLYTDMLTCVKNLCMTVQIDLSVVSSTF